MTTETRWTRCGSARGRWRGRVRTASRSPPGSTGPAAALPSRASEVDPPPSGTVREESTGRTRDFRRCPAPRPGRRSCRSDRRTIRRRRSRRARSECPRRAAARPLRGKVCARFAARHREPPWRSRGDAIHGGRIRPGRNREAAAPVRQIVDRRHQLLGRQITGDAEDHQDARSGDPRQSAVVRVAKEDLGSRSTIN